MSDQCQQCGRSISSPLKGTQAVHEQTGKRITLDGLTCRVCLSASGYVSARVYDEEQATKGGVM